MAKTKKPDHVSEIDGYRVEWRRRRSEMDADVYGPNQDPKTDEPLEELGYPKVPGMGTLILDEFAEEAVRIAKRNQN